MNPERLSPIYVQAAGKSGENLARALERRKGRPLNILSLSGGGQNGAFGAGFLNGWRERGKRPKFDAVGGVSTGALLATHALLGTPEDDATLARMYTGITSITAAAAMPTRKVKLAMYMPQDTWSVMPVVMRPWTICLHQALRPSRATTVRASIQA